MPPRRRLAVAPAISLMAVGALAAPPGAVAQASPLVLEVHAGAALPVGHFESGTRAGEGTEPGASFGVDFALPGGKRFVPYIGFSQHRFGCEGAGCGASGRYVATGFHAGYRFVPLPDRSLLPWVRVGVVTTRVETDALGGANAGTSKLGLGAELGAGLHIGGARTLALNPAVRAVAVNTELLGGPLLRMRYLVADLALVVSF